MFTAAVAGDLAGLDGAAADFLPPRDVSLSLEIRRDAGVCAFLGQFLAGHLPALGGFWGDPAVHGWVNSGKDG
jgi:hypothetical protein